MTDAGTAAATAPAAVPVVRLPRRRGIELALIVLAVTLSVYGYCAVGLARAGRVPPGRWRTGPGSGCSRCSRISPYGCGRRTPIRCRCPSGCCSTGSAWC
ncbi:hypothetical protein SRO_2521 [Streptomyces rochei]|nr:hypothetical protein SRO_2521 [Streptomyces rochei]